MTGDELRHIRVSRDMTQGDFAKRLEIGERSVRRYELSGDDIPVYIALAAEHIKATVPIVDQTTYEQIRRRRYRWRETPPRDD